MMGTRTTAFAVTILALSACQPTTGGIATNSAIRQTPEPSVALLSYDGLGNCSVTPRTVPAPFLVVDPRDDYYGAESDAMSQALDGYAEAIGRLGAAAFVSSSAQAQLRDALLSWAEANAMQWPRNWNDGNDSGPATVYFTTQTIVPTIIAYGEHRALFSAEEQQTIELRLKQLVNRTGNNERMRRWSVDNKGYLWGSAALAFGIVTQDDSFIRRGTATYYTAIRNLRADGSLPQDSGRGGSAVHYTNEAISSLILTAELAAGQGIDLYGFESRGRTIHDAIRFLLDATENPSIIAGYASQYTGAGFRGFDANNQRLTWMNANNASWGVYYAKRFEGSELAERLKRISSFVRSPRPESDGGAGGVARCLA